MTFAIDPRDKVRIVQHVAPLVPLLYDASEYATQATRTFFDVQAIPEAKERDSYLAAHLIRFHVGSMLRARGQDVQIDPLWLPNSGVAFTHGWASIRYLKAAGGLLPAPGYSRVKRAFYRQIVEPSLWADENDRSTTSVNLVITWDLDSRGNLSTLTLYSPSGGGTARDSARSFWSEPLMHPALTIEPEVTAAEEPGEDLDIFRDEPDQQDEDLAQ